MLDDTIEEFLIRFLKLLNLIESTHIFYFFIIIFIAFLLLTFASWNKEKSLINNLKQMPENAFGSLLLVSYFPIKLLLTLFFGLLIIWLIFNIPEFINYLSKFEWKEFLIRSFGIICIVYSSHIIFVEYYQNIEKKWIRTRFLLSVFLGIYSILIF